MNNYIFHSKRYKWLLRCFFTFSLFYLNSDRLIRLSNDKTNDTDVTKPHQWALKSEMVWRRNHKQYYQSVGYNFFNCDILHILTFIDRVILFMERLSISLLFFQPIALLNRNGIKKAPTFFGGWGFFYLSVSSPLGKCNAEWLTRSPDLRLKGFPKSQIQFGHPSCLPHLPIPPRARQWLFSQL